MKRIFRLCLLIAFVAALATFWGCSGDSEQSEIEPAETSELAAPTEPVTLRDTIENVLNEAVDRVRYGDRSGLYENEFEYMRQTVNFDDYIKLRHVHYANADTLKFLEVLDLMMYEHDSADAVLYVHFEGPTGVPSQLKDTITVFYHNDRWIKPTASNMGAQLEWEEETGRR